MKEGEGRGGLTEVPLVVHAVSISIAIFVRWYSSRGFPPH